MEDEFKDWCSTQGCTINNGISCHDCKRIWFHGFEASKATAQQRCDKIADILYGLADASENGEILQHKLLRDLARELRNIHDKESE